MGLELQDDCDSGTDVSQRDNNDGAQRNDVALELASGGELICWEIPSPQK